MTSAELEPKAPPSFSMQNKVCVVTGAAKGLGFEFCRAFIASGCTSLVVVDLIEDEAKAAANDLIAYALGTLNGSPYPNGDTFKANGDTFKVNGDTDQANGDAKFKFIGIGCDVSSELDVKKAFARVLETFGRLDAVVASAGVVENYPALDYPTDRMKWLYDINVHGCFFTAREAARYMIPQGGGSIVLIASASANIVNIPQLQTPYNASKAAVKHMAASLGVEWAKTGVRVNSLSPGYIMTKLTKTILEKNPELKKFWVSLTPIGRMGEPEDLAGAIVFLASDASKFMTGAELRVDGGYTCV